MADEEPGRRVANPRMQQPNLMLRPGDRRLVRLMRRSKKDERLSSFAFITRHPALEKLNAFGDPYEVDGIRLTWLDTVLFESLLLADDEIKQLAKKMMKRDAWSSALSKQAEAAVQRIFEQQYLPKLRAKFDDVIRHLCAEYALVSLIDEGELKAEAAEWFKTHKKRKVPKDFLNRQRKKRG